MDDLITFLGERLDEDEWIAREADGISRDSLMDLYEDLIKSRPLDDQRRAYGIHLGHFRPSRMLDDIQAKRRTLTMLSEAHDRAQRAAQEQRSADAAMYVGKVSALLDAAKVQAKVQAMVYASHREYRKEWRP